MRAADLFGFRRDLRAGLLRAVTNLPEPHWDWRPPGGVHAIRHWLWHIAETEDWWMQAVVLGQAGFQARRRPAAQGKAEVLDYLARTRGATEACLLECAEAQLQETRHIPAPAPIALQGRALTVYDILNRVFQHEVHHRAQIFLYLRLMGIDPPDAT